MSDGVRVLIAEDQESEREIYKAALRKCGGPDAYFVHDGVDCIDYLRGEKQFADRAIYPFPTCMLLDLKMPRLNGFEVLKWMFDHPDCRVIPTVVMSNSNMEDDIDKAYKLGANAFFTKPSTLREMVEVLALIHHFWTVSQRPRFPAHYTCGESK